MSSNELVPLFPSATHPAIPVAAGILSTLRHLTAPGKGNDLKPEERAALVGVSALLGCERIQSKDLLLSSAQKASSVSPAHFRSTLTRCRKLLESVPSTSTSPSTSPSKRSPRSQSSKRPSSANAAANENEEGEGSQVTTADVLNPLSTPKKKYKFSSGVDISSLVKTPRTPRYEPSTASPLRHSVTRIPSTKGPGTSTFAHTVDELDPIGENEDGIEDEPEMGTPTKKIKYSNPVGVDLEHPPTKAGMRSSRKAKEDAAAFFALRPGAKPDSTPGRGRGQAGEGQGAVVKEGEGEGEEWMHRLPRPQAQRKVARSRAEQERERRKIRPVDWTYTERVWGRQEGEVTHHDILDEIWAQLPAWLEKNSRPPVEATEVRGKDAGEVLANALCAKDEGMDVDLGVSVGEAVQ